MTDMDMRPWIWKIFNGCALTDSVVEAIVDHFPHLHALQLSHASCLSAAAFQQMFRPSYSYREFCKFVKRGIRQGLQNLNHVFFVMAAFCDLSFKLPPAQLTTETCYTMEDLITAINTIESHHRGYKHNILSALNNHGHSCTSLDTFLSLQAGKARLGLGNRPLG
ncbi:hypothetical protein QOT17_014419 [Balamuthia mandrillaris]